MKNITLVFSIGCALLLSLSCTKEEPKDQEYVRCLFNGEPWEDCCDCPNPWGGGNGLNIDCTYRPGSEDLTLGTANNCQGRENLSGINLRSKFALSGNGKVLFRGNEAIDLSKDCKQNFHLDTTSENYLLIDSYDLESKVINGTFGFAAIDPCGNIVRITEGEFRVPFRLP